MAKPPANPVKQFDEAVEWFRKRLAISPEEFAALEAEAKRRAFSIAGATQMSVVKDVWDAVDKAVAEGVSLGKFKKEVGPALTEEWGKKNSPRVETIYRTNTQHAYNAGRWKQATHPAVLKMRPYWKLQVEVDDRTSEVCEDLAGTILPANDPWWDSHYPPLHFNCRSAVTTLSREQAEAEGIDTSEDDGEDADEGFGRTPDQREWSPDKADYPPEVWAAHEKKNED